MKGRNVGLYMFTLYFLFYLETRDGTKKFHFLFDNIYLLVVSSVDIFDAYIIITLSQRNSLVYQYTTVYQPSTVLVYPEYIHG